jgi:hemerythrin superfamily protein
MNAIDMLIEQHRELEAAFEALEDADESSQRGLFEQVADTLMSHVLIEERHFYPAVKAKRTEDILLESLEEHLSLKRLVADLLALSPEHEHFAAKLHVLKEQLEHHHEEEEEKLFPRSKKVLSEDELEGLGETLQAAQTKLLSERPRKLAPQQTAEAPELS